jgi:serine/threonine-protein kinase RsbW
MLETIGHRLKSFVPAFAWSLPEMTGGEAFATVLNAAGEKMAAHGFSRRDVFAMRLALEEALVNAARHGNKVDPAEEVSPVWEVGDDLSEHIRLVWTRAGSAVRVFWTVTPERVRVSVEDEGAGFDPGPVRNPIAPENLARSGGRGLLLMRHYMTRVVHLPPGNCVVMFMERPASTGGAGGGPLPGPRPRT